MPVLEVTSEPNEKRERNFLDTKREIFWWPIELLVNF